MLEKTKDGEFPRINRGYNSVFKPNRLSIGLVLPIEAYAIGAKPTMAQHIETVQLAEVLGYSALWLRDVPFDVPSFGDVGQMFDPFVYLGTLAASTNGIALGTASIILPLRHPAHVAKAIRDDTILVSIMHSNNEIGTIQPVADISKVCRSNGVLFHTDAAQAVGKIQIELSNSNIDLLSISGHKMYGPKGIGALFVSNNLDFPLVPLFHGGGQQGGQRSGTLSPALCVGLGEAANLASSSISEENFRISNLKNRLLAGLKEQIDTLWVNGGSETLPNIISVGFSDIDASNLLSLMQTKLAASTGSACNSGLIEPSYALVSIGLNHLEASSVVRFSIGRMTTEDEIDTAISIISETYKRAISLAA